MCSCELILLVDVAGFVYQVQHHAVGHRLVELVSMDITAEYFQAGLLVFFEQRRTGEAYEHRVGQYGLHNAVQPSALGTVALVYKYKQLAFLRWADCSGAPGYTRQTVCLAICRTYAPGCTADVERAG